MIWKVLKQIHAAGDSNETYEAVFGGVENHGFTEVYLNVDDALAREGRGHGSYFDLGDDVKSLAFLESYLRACSAVFRAAGEYVRGVRVALEKKATVEAGIHEALYGNKE